MKIPNSIIFVIALLFIIFVIGMIVYTAFKSRYCVFCDIKMKPHVTHESIFPDYYYCEKCGNKIYTKISDEHSATL